MTLGIALGVLRERPTAAPLARDLSESIGRASAAAEGRRSSGDGPRLTEADLFAAYSIGIAKGRR